MKMGSDWPVMAEVAVIEVGDIRSNEFSLAGGQRVWLVEQNLSQFIQMFRSLRAKCHRATYAG
jgi:hypothetical protein